MMLNNPARVLLVDDNPDDAEIIGRLLKLYQKAAFALDWANSTAECIAYLEDHVADLILLDYAMPAEDGISFLRRASRTIDLPPVILVSGTSDQRMAADAIRLGARNYIHKNSLTSQLLGMAVEEVLNAVRREEELLRFDENVIQALIRTSESVDPTAGGPRLATLAVSLGRGLGMTLREVEMLRRGALLTDIGKLGVRNEVIRKPEPLTEEEFDEVRMHPIIGERMGTDFHIQREVLLIIRHHHERWDGKGYVDGLAGEDIPELARVISVVDAFDAMTVSRPYREPLTLDEAMSRLEKGAGTQWDPRMVEVFLKQASRLLSAA